MLNLNSAVNSKSRILNLNFELEFVPVVSNGLAESLRSGIGAWLLKFKLKGFTYIVKGLPVQPQSNTLLIMETLDSQIQYYEKKLSKIPEEYNTSMIYEGSAIREKELYFRREICRLDNIKKEIELKNKYFTTPVVIKKQEDELKPKDKEILEVKEIVQKNNIEYITNEEEQWEINNKFLLESYEEEENNAESYQDFIDSI